MDMRKRAAEISLFFATLLLASQVLAQSETEPNDTKQTADVITHAISGNLSVGTDEDWYVYTANISGTLDLNFSAPAGDGDYSWRITVLDNSGNVLNDIGAGRDIELFTNISSGDSYFIQIRRGLSFDASGYSLSVNADLGVVLEAEPNDDQQSANSLADRIVGSLHSSEDEDWYVFTAGTTDTFSLTFSVAGFIYNNHWHVSILDNSGNVLAGGSVGESLLLNTGLIAGSTYYVQVKLGLSVLNSSQYVLSVNSNSNLIAETEPNNSQLSADTLVNGIAGNLSTVIDEDWYVYTATSANAFGVRFVVDENSSFPYWNVSIFDSGGTVLTAGETGRNLELLAGAFPGETYYVRVMQGSSGSANSASYSLDIFTTVGVIVESESNDDQQTANALINGISGNLSTEFDQDWYVLTADVTGAVNLHFTVEESSISKFWDVSIQDNMGTILAGGDTGDNLELVAGVSEGDIYYVRVQQGSHFDASPTRYTLSISTSSIANTESESNDNQQSADALIDGISGNLSSVSDQDWYVFNAPTTGSIGLKFEANQEDSLARWHVSILDSNGAVLTASYADPDLELYTGLTQGVTYYVRIMASGSLGVAVQYSLNLITDLSFVIETEPNDDQQFADGLVNDIAGNLSSADDSDWYIFSATKTGTVELGFEVGSDSINIPWRVSIQDSEGNTLSARESDRSFELLTGVSEGRTYYVHISSVLGRSVPTDQYILRLNADTDLVSEMEPNDERSSANTYVEGILGSLSTAADQDWYVFTAVDSGTHTLDFSIEESFFNAEWSVAILDSDGQFLTGGNAGDNNSINKFSIGLSAASTYYISVQYGGGVIYPNLYSLEIEFDPTLVSETSANGDMESADVLVNGIVGNISSENDEDWYVVHVETPSTLEVGFFVDENILRTFWHVSIWDSEGGLLAEADSSGSSELSKFIASSGDVFVRVSQGGHFSNSAQYSLTFKFILSIVESGTAALMQLGQCVSEANCLGSPRVYITQLKTSDPGISGVSELSLFDSDLQVESATIAGYSGPSFTPYLESFAYTSGSNHLSIDTTALQSYRFERTGVLTVSASLSYSQTGSAEVFGGAPTGLASATVRAFQMDGDELDLTRCNLIADGELEVDVDSFGLCMLARGQTFSGSKKIEIEGIEVLQNTQIMGNSGVIFAGREYPEVLNQSLEKQFEIQGLEGDVLFLLAHSSTLVHSGGSAEVNNFALEFMFEGEEPLVLPAFQEDTKSPLPSRSISSVAHVSNGILLLPLIQVGDKSYSAEFSIVAESEPLQIQLVSAREIFNVDGLERGTFAEDLLTVPNVSFEGNLYSAQFRYVDEELLLFELLEYHQK